MQMYSNKTHKSPENPSKTQKIQIDSIFLEKTPGFYQNLTEYRTLQNA